MLLTRNYTLAPVLLIAFLLAACGPGDGSEDSTTSSSSMKSLLSGGNGAPDSSLDDESYEHLTATDGEVPPMLKDLTKSWKGDFDGMVERRLVRALVNANSTGYFLDGPQQKGLTYEALKSFEEEINKDLGTKNLKVYVVIIPTTRDRLLPDLIAGRGDIAASNLTITPDRQKTVDFIDPLAKDVEEIVVTGPATEPVTKLADLSGREIWVRPSSSYRKSLEDLNRSLREQGLAKVEIRDADERLETEDLLEMVNAGLLPATVADDYLVGLWSEIFDKLVPLSDAPLRTGGQLAWATRQGSPQLTRVLNKWGKKYKQGTLMGNILIKRYLKEATFVRNAFSEDSLNRYQETVRYFQKYAGDYDFETLMVVAQAFQESGLDQTKKSNSGAVGIMQLLPSTAADPNVAISDIHQLENNIHAGVKYLRFLRDRYFSDEELSDLDKMLFTFAAYNAGPRRVAQLRQKAVAMKLDPNIWFQNVEVVAAREIGRETVQYVSNIYKYYLAYQTLEANLRARDRARSGKGGG